MIKINNLYYNYKDNNVLNGINLEIKDGELVALVGKNGSGKSTLGRLISGITKIKKGNILIDDLDISKNYDSLLNKIGIVFQNPENQIIFNNIYDELSFSLRNLEKNQVEEKINAALEKVNMLEYRNKDLYSLSLGQKQRIMIAEVLAKDPKYIILDEPTAMIDTHGKEKIYEIIKKLHGQGYTIILITNIADEILIADRTLILDNGKIIREIHKEDLLDNLSILKKYGIEEPTIMKIVSLLNNSNIKLNLSEYSIKELVNKLKEIINEKHN